MVWVSHRAGYQLRDAGYTERDFVLNLFLVHTWVPNFTVNWNYPSWSISSEWFAYLLFPLAVAGMLRHLTTPLRATAAGGLWLTGSIAVMLCWRPWPFYELVLVVPTFLAGAAVYWALRDRLGTGDSRVARWSPEVLVVVAATSVFVLPSAPAVVVLLSCFLGLIVVLPWLGEHCHFLWSAWPAVFLGETSYSLYMTHTLAQKVVYRLLPSPRFDSAEVLTKLGVIAVYILLVTLSCLGTYYCVERPCRGFFKRAMRRRDRPPEITLLVKTTG